MPRHVCGSVIAAMTVFLLCGCPEPVTNACGPTVTRGGPDDRTALGPTARELVDAWQGRGFDVAWRDPGTPLPSRWTLSILEDDLESESIRWAAEPRCPTLPSVRLDAPVDLLSDDAPIRGTGTFEWYDEGPGRDSRSGEPIVLAELPVNDALAEWCRNVVSAEVDHEIVGVGWSLSLVTRSVRLNATFRGPEGVETNHPSEEVNAFFADVELLD